MEGGAEHRVFVLIVEDEDDNAELMVRALRADARLWVARTIEEARQTLQNNQVHVVVSDHRLPDGTGTGLLSFVRQAFPKIGRVLVTAYGDSREVVDACDQGTVERFFLKPFSPQQLRSGVLGLLRRYGVVSLPRVLVADNNPDVLAAVANFLERKFIDVHTVTDGMAAVAALEREHFDAAVIDVGVPELDGLGVLRRALNKDAELPIIIMTGIDLSIGLPLLQSGAFDLVAKPIRNEELAMRLERAIIARRQSEEHKQLLNEMRASRLGDELVAESDAMQTVVEQVRMVAKHDVSVLIVGETGTGKEVIARLLHRESCRRESPFLPVNCGAIPETLIEAELFGHERGAFTDAKQAKIGFFEAADGGTLLLDEVGELSLSAQIRLLRVLETREIQRLGATKLVRVDVRVLAATHRDLEALVKEGRFREDLYYRLNGFTVRIPPLRERPADIAPLIQMVARNFCLRNGLPIPEITSTALQQARAHVWRGNVRELLHVVERTLITHGPSRIDRLEVQEVRREAGLATDVIDASRPMRETLTPIFEQLEKSYLAGALALCDGQLGRTAAHAGIHRKSLYNKLKHHGISVKTEDDD